MKAIRLRLFIFIISSLFLITGPEMALSEQPAVENTPLEQPLVREGDLAVKLVEALKLGTAKSESEAESILASLDIMPQNGWIADYPVTPDIVSELQIAVGNSAESGKIAMNKDDAQKTVQGIMSGLDLPITVDNSGEVAAETTAPNYPDPTLENNYYYDQGPPVVTYYAPPPDYAYLYTWVPYPFWWSAFWFPGFFILGDFHDHVDRHRHWHGYDHNHHKYISNHFVDPQTGGTFRVDPANRSRGRMFSGGAGWSRPSARSGAQAIFNSSQTRPSTGIHREFRGYGTSRPHTGFPSTAPGNTSQAHPAGGARREFRGYGTPRPYTGISPTAPDNTSQARPAARTYREFRGYGTSGPRTGIPSSVFDRSPSSQFERNASDRGFQSRSGTSTFSGGKPAGGGNYQGRGFGSFGGFHGGGHR